MRNSILLVQCPKSNYTSPLETKLEISDLEKNVNVSILIKITHCQDLDRTFLQNRTTDFDETLHVAWV